eukprot:4208595-Prorocentrum_lima.AAC.1
MASTLRRRRPAAHQLPRLAAERRHLIMAVVFFELVGLADSSFLRPDWLMGRARAGTVLRQGSGILEGWRET